MSDFLKKDFKSVLVIVYDVFDNHFDMKRLHHRYESRVRRREVKLTSNKIG